MSEQKNKRKITKPKKCVKPIKKPKKLKNSKTTSDKEIQTEIISKLIIENDEEEEEIEKCKPLLMAYRYNVGQYGKKVISVGYDPDDERFNISFLIEETSSNKNIKMSYNEWCTLFSKREDITLNFKGNNETLKVAYNQLMVFDHEGNPFDYTYKISEGLSLIISSISFDLKVLRFDDENGSSETPTKVKMFLSFEEWMDIYNWMEFFNGIITYNLTLRGIIETYYNLYLQKCIEAKKVIKTLANYVSPLQYMMETPTLTSTHGFLSTFNYFRLYNEISNICCDRVLKHLQQQ